MTTYMITGVGGFIGANLAERLLALGHTVIGVDKLNLFNHKLMGPELQAHPNFRLFDYNLTYDELHIDYEIDTVFHLAASADIRFSSERPDRDFDSFVATYRLLMWMKDKQIRKLVYASSAAMYGDPSKVPVFESYNPTQTSFYGASKMSCEAFIQAWCHSYANTAWIFRYVSILGERYSHGFVYNFYRELKKDPTRLYVHGSKTQHKSYLYVQDCIDGMFLALAKRPLGSCYTFNMGHQGTISLDRSIPIITKHMGVSPKIEWSGNRVGWIGDSHSCYLSCHPLETLGWKREVSIAEAIERTLTWLDNNQWILELRQDK